MTYETKIAKLLNLRPQQVSAAIDLLDAGNTVPFIARYRKEMTFSLDEDALRKIFEEVERLRALDERREAILNSIEEQGLMTPELQNQLQNAETLTELEDLYLPYRPKRRTRASIARERGLEGLSALILQQPTDGQKPENAAKGYLNDEVPTVEEALQGARDIAAEVISDDARVRAALRDKAGRWGVLLSEKIKDAADEKAVYETYYEFNYRVDRLKPYQVLAINRGEHEKVLRVKVEVAERDWLESIQQVYHPNRRSAYSEQLELAITDSAKRLLLPAIERDIRRTLTEWAEKHAIHVFAANLRGLLRQPPLIDHIVMGIDPAYRTGCKIAVIDRTGKVLATAAVYPHAPQRQWNEALDALAKLIEKYGVTLISIGNGTASRETEALVAELTRAVNGVHYLLVNEAGASVYSASPLARAELPDLDVTLRGAVSIARRVQDPLAELVKIDPKSIGIGLYQHDVDQKQLGAALDGVVETVVNQVGVDVNTASAALLAHVAGIGPKLAEKIVAFRDSKGTFPHREALKQVSGMGAKAFEQSAGFMRIRQGENPLDSSAIHPESYSVAEGILKKARLTLHSSLEARKNALDALLNTIPVDVLAAEQGVGVPTLQDILDQLVRPGRDPREDLPAPILRSDVLSMEDLTVGMRLDGTIRNVVDFGAFIDIGVKQDGLLHNSQIPPGNKLNVGQILNVQILSVDQDRGRIGLGWVDES